MPKRNDPPPEKANPLAGFWEKPRQPADCWAYDPGAMLTALGLQPDPWQVEFLNMKYRRALLLCSRRSGKTTAVAVKALHHALFPPPGEPVTVLIFAPAGKQSEELLHTLHTCYRKLGQPVPRETDKVSQLDFANGSRIIPLTSNPDSAVGFTPTLVIIDEAARVEDALYQAIAPMRALGKAQLIALSTPHGKRGFFYREWTGTGEWYRVRKTADDCPRIDRSVIEEDRQSFGESYVRQEYGCSFEVMEGLVYPEFESCIIDPRPIRVERAWCGVDFGWRNPSAALVIACDHDDCMYAVEEFYKKGVTDEELALHLRDMAERWPIERFFCDSEAPQSIHKLRVADLPAIPAIKNKKPGIRAVGARIRTGRLRCFRTCENLIAEMGLYHYDPETKLTTDEPVKEFDHLADCLRYVCAFVDKVKVPHGMKEPPPPGEEPERPDPRTPAPPPEDEWQPDWSERLDSVPWDRW